MRLRKPTINLITHSLEEEKKCLQHCISVMFKTTKLGSERQNMHVNSSTQKIFKNPKDICSMTPKNYFEV